MPKAGFSRVLHALADADVDVTLNPKPQSPRELVAKAERDCFVGASLTARPRYHWTVNGEELL
jgi:methylmalonyl-CoA mutase cobalamin-binding subunit